MVQVYLGRRPYVHIAQGLKELHWLPVDHHIEYNRKKLECGPMPNVMAALPNIVGPLCLMPQSLADAHYQRAVQ